MKFRSLSHYKILVISSLWEHVQPLQVIYVLSLLDGPRLRDIQRHLIILPTLHLTKNSSF